jgi:hypothetical protein
LKKSAIGSSGLLIRTPLFRPHVTQSLPFGGTFGAADGLTKQPSGQMGLGLGNDDQAGAADRHILCDHAFSTGVFALDRHEAECA